MTTRRKMIPLHELIDKVLEHDENFECNQYEDCLEKVYFYNYFPKDALDEYVVEVDFLIDDLLTNKYTHHDVIKKIQEATIAAREYVLGASIN